jgi:hypothetical protein
MKRFRLFPFRSPLLWESRLLSVPAGTKMYQFSALPRAELCIHSAAILVAQNRVAPFGNPRIKRCLLFPEAYRSLPRPSSAPHAKASPVRS